MKEQNSNRTRIVGLRLTPDEYAKIEKKWKASTCRKLSDYVRRSLFDKPVVTTYRNSSQDDLMAELTRLRSELNAVGNNFNQAVKKLHTLSQIAEFKSWLIAYEVEKKILSNKVDEVRINVKKILEIWLQ
ncbi:plasmid mobilization protein [Sediminibacterium soli]|uniref:plasmid mobilization protein n=1 Tax=Sediminibacterium soli TaxID=2698829 RepID=UPI00137B22BC|nr:plasmid mobilization relaxosome protein MobC [Sediminibacterium soli]NCI46715.1 plasmid mobilization relaxosome protein MobC [Sediminibacterium soli]